MSQSILHTCAKWVLQKNVLMSDKRRSSTAVSGTTTASPSFWHTVWFRQAKSWGLGHFGKLSALSPVPGKPHPQTMALHIQQRCHKYVNMQTQIQIVCLCVCVCVCVCVCASVCVSVCVCVSSWISLSCQLYRVTSERYLYTHRVNNQTGYDIGWLHFCLLICFWGIVDGRIYAVLGNWLPTQKLCAPRRRDITLFSHPDCT